VPDTIVGVFTVSDRSQVALPTESADSTARFFPPTHSFSQEFLSLRSSRNTSTSLIYRCQLLGFAVRVLNNAEFHPPTHSTLLESDAPTTTRRLGILVQRLSDSDLIRFTGDQLAQHCSCSVRHFRRLFRQVMGVSLQQKQSELRMLKAKQLLVETNMPVVEVALECGFHHQSLFHSMFKTWFGVTPGQWRTQNRPSPSVPTREADPGIGHALTSS
jgi:AraC-like DNA-binding protein